MTDETSRGRSPWQVATQPADDLHSTLCFAVRWYGPFGDLLER